ncbi:MAG: ABC transporter ATP-binding protein [Acidimicrobiia bacterium]|nr:ABC transporter ATP-binding protein [Acidimicrobiia bacterium]
MALYEVDSLDVAVKSGEEWRPAVVDASFSVDEGEVLALVGESGSGKSLIALGGVGLLPFGTKATGGKAYFEGHDLSAVDDAEWRKLVGLGIGVLFQDPIGAWDPTEFLGQQAGEVLDEHFDMDPDEIEQRVVDALGEVRLPEKRRFLWSFAHEMSRGEAQRAMLAATLLSGPRLLIADEPLSGLDPTVASAVTSIIRDLRERRGMALLLITHDLGVVAGLADRVAVVYGGRIVEEGPVDLIFHSPRHPYTAGLLASLPGRGRRLKPIPGDVPDIAWLDPGCPFAPRCEFAIDGCRAAVPQPSFVRGALVRCIRAAELDLEGVGRATAD